MRGFKVKVVGFMEIKRPHFEIMGETDKSCMPIPPTPDWINQRSPPMARVDKVDQFHLYKCQIRPSCLDEIMLKILTTHY